MQRFELTVLGSNSAMAAHGRHPSAQVLNLREHLFLIDCGEGTQMRMDDFAIRRSRIEHIFISHLHGDHVFGLVGLLMSYGLMGRSEPLHVYSPPGLRRVIEVQLQATDSELSYALHFHETEPERHACIFQNQDAEVYTLPLKHGIPCNGYLFREKPAPRRMLKEAIARWQIPVEQIPSIKLGGDLTLPDGNIVANAELTADPLPVRSFAYCSDTLYDEALVPLLSGVDLLYHEATYCQSEQEQARKYFHSTALQAANIALQAGAKSLLLGHFSSRYGDLSPLLDEARSIFPNSHLATEGKTFVVR